VWDEEDVMVAMDWAMEHGFVQAEYWGRYGSPRIVRAALAEDLDPYDLVYPGYFVSGYLRAAIETSLGGERLWTEQSFAPEALARMIADCREFENENQKTLFEAYDMDARFSPRRAGRDFWMSRNGSYEGFRTDDALGLLAAGVLNTKALEYGPFQIYLGDDDLIWFEDDPKRCRLWGAY
jgi:hypothetical protein